MEGKFLKSQRLRVGISQGKVAKMLGIGTQYISNVEREKCYLSSKYFKKIAKIYSIQVETLINMRIESFSKDLRDAVYKKRNGNDNGVNNGQKAKR